jgi:hypothetical protein
LACQLAFEHVGDDLHVTVPMGAKAHARCDIVGMAEPRRHCEPVCVSPAPRGNARGRAPRAQREHRTM